MKVKDLIKILQECDPEAIVTTKECKNYSRVVFYRDVSVGGVYISEDLYDNLGRIYDVQDCCLEKANVILVG